MKITPEMIAQMEAPITKYERSDSTEKRCVAAAFRLLIADLEKARCRIHDLETICDPAGLTIENALSKDQIAALQIMYRKAADELAATKVRLEEAIATRGSSVLVPAPKLEEMQAEVAALRKQLAAAQSSEAHWRANHDNVARKLRFFTQRDDLPVDRLPAYEYVLELEKQLAEAQAKLAHLAEYWNRDENEIAMKDACWHTVEVAEASDTSALDTAIAEAIEPYRKDAARWKELLSRLGDDSGPTIVKIEGWSDEYPGYAWFADLTQEQVIAELDTSIAAEGETE